MPTTRLGKDKGKEADKNDKNAKNSKKDDVPEVGFQLEPSLNHFDKLTMKLWWSHNCHNHGWLVVTGT